MCKFLSNLFSKGKREAEWKARLATDAAGIIEWETSLAQVKVGVKKPTGFPVYEIGWNDLKASLSEVGLELMLKDKFVPDAKIFYTDLQSWSKMVPFLTFSGEYYTQGTDCDDYGRRASVESAFEFGLNGCLECWGHMPQGYHAFALVLTGPKSFMLFEPNAGFGCAGELFKDGGNGYKAESWKV